MEVRRDIFISYKDNDEGEIFAAELKKILESKGFSVYFNPDEHRADDFTEKIRIAVENCKDFLLIVSKKCFDALMSGNEKDWVRFELLTARANNKNIIPILLKGVKMPVDFDAMPEDVRFLPKIDNIEIDKIQHLYMTPVGKMIEAIVSKPEKDDIYRDTYNSNSEYDVTKDFSETLKKAKEGNPEAMYEIANMYFYGFSGKNGGATRDFPEAYKWFKATAETDNEYSALAEGMIAKMYYRGVVPREGQSFEKAFEYHTKASEKSVYSQNQCAYMLSVGLGCDFDFDLAEKKYLEVVEKGDNPSISGLAVLYRKYGRYDKVVELYKKIINTDSEAAYELGKIFKSGVLSNPPEPDCFKAAFYFTLAIRKGYADPDVYYQLGLLYFHGSWGFIRDFAIAQENFMIAADAGHIESQYLTGYMYEHGFCEYNIEKAVKYHKMAADNGHKLSPTHLAILYQQPECLNYHQAFKYAALAASRKEKEGEFVFGNLLFFGRGCQADVNKAYEMYKMAAEHGCDQALFMLKRIDSMEK